jgi:serine/threonine-protein kinase HipA
MSTAYTVHLDFLGHQFVIGRLFFHSRGNKESASFYYENDWLSNPIGFALQPSLPFVAGQHNTEPGEKLFGCFSDCSPDRWGRVLMQRKETKLARGVNRQARTLLERDYLLQVNDVVRQGALRFTASGSDVFLAPPESGVPTRHNLRELMAAAKNVSQKTESANDLLLLFQPGGSLGGARPKAAVQGLNGELLTAKFPKPDDDWDIPLWEYVSFELAKRAGIRTPAVELHRVDEINILLISRFDRTMNGGRIPFASAMTLLSAHDGDRRSYLEIGEILSAEGSQPSEDWRELYRRMIFNILTSNFDDHLRNHGFLREERGWRLSPVYDLESVPNKLAEHQTYITLLDGQSSLDLALEHVEDFFLSLAEAKEIIKSVAESVRHWDSTARGAGASKHDMELMETAYGRADVAGALRF